MKLGLAKIAGAAARAALAGLARMKPSAMARAKKKAKPARKAKPPAKPKRRRPRRLVPQAPVALPLPAPTPAPTPAPAPAEEAPTLVPKPAQAAPPVVDQVVLLDAGPSPIAGPELDELLAAPAPEPPRRGPRACSVCGELGHRSDNVRRHPRTGATDLDPPAADASNASPTDASPRGPADDQAPVDDEDEDDEPPPEVARLRDVALEQAKDGRARAKTIAPRPLSRAEKLAIVPYPDDVVRPQTREDCRGGERPCPFVSCSQHLYLDVNEESGAIKLNFPHLEVWQMAETCALDVADRGGITLEEVGAILNLTRERIRQVEVRGLHKIRTHGADQLDLMPDRPAGNLQPL